MTGTGSGKKSDESCTELVPYNAEKAAKIAAGINSDSEGSRTVYDILSDSEDSCGTTTSSDGASSKHQPVSILPDICTDDSSEDTEPINIEIKVVESDSSSSSSDNPILIATKKSNPPTPHVTPKKQTVTPSNSSNTPAKSSPTERPHSTTTPSHSMPKKRKSSNSPTEPQSAAKYPRLSRAMSAVQYQGADSEDDKKLVKGKKGKNPDGHLPGPASSKLVDSELLDQLVADQAKYPPQHEPGKCQEFKADEQRIRYFLQVMHVKLQKYWNLNAAYYRVNNRMVPLACPSSQFVEYYWPGQAICCGMIRHNSSQLDKHIQRVHKPPKSPPALSVVPLSVKESNDSDSESTTPIRRDSVSPEAKLKAPPGFLTDQNKFPPQHKPGEPEEFLANQESIEYFLDALKLKREKYTNMIPIKDKPLSGTYADFVFHYWPGMASCCDRVQLSCKEFHQHLTSCHLPPKDLPKPAVTDMQAVDRARAGPSTPAVSSTSRFDGSPVLASPRLNKRRSRPTVEAGPSSSLSASQHGDLTPSQQSSKEMGTINSPFMDEARKLRARATQSSSLKELLPVLERILDMMTGITMRMRGLVGVCPPFDLEARATTVECLEFVWSSSKSAILRWEDLKGRTTRDASLSAVQYAYGGLPVFVNWEDSKHLDMVESVVVLCKNTVKNWAPNSPVRSDALAAYRLNPSATAAAIAAAGPKRRSLSVLSPMRREMSPCSSSSGDSPARMRPRNLDALVELCRRTNVAVWQDTKSRPDHKDDAGNYHAVYRYSFKKILDLYFPAEVSHLMCCGVTLDRPSLAVHVAKHHESGIQDRTEPTISLP